MKSLKLRICFYGGCPIRKFGYVRLSYVLSFLLSFGAISNVNAKDVVNYLNETPVENQSKTIKGRVVDEKSEPIIGVTIQVKGTTNAAMTDAEGNFTMNITSSSKTLVASYIGYKQQEIAIDNQRTFNIKLVPDTKSLDEIVIIGYGAVKKRDLTGAITSVKNDEITLTPATNPMQALQGRVAGLDITKSSGQAGSGVDIQLRGTRSFTASGTPTFIIDGMPGDYSTLNPNDIESIEVLKDASSTAVYGSSGANGVIIITTKQGKAGKTNVNFDAYAGFNGMSILPKMRKGDSYINVMREAAEIAGTYIDDESLFTSSAAYQAHLNGEYIDWAKELMQTGFTQNYSLSVSGGTDKTKAYFSMNFSDEQGQYKTDDYKLYSTNMRIDHKVKNWLSIGTNLQSSYVYQNKAYAKLINALVSCPLGTAYNEDGSVNVTPVIGDDNTINLLLDQDKSVYRNQSQNFKMYFNPYIELRPIKGLSILSRVNASLTYSRSNYFQGMGSYQYYNASGSTATGTNSNVYATITEDRGYNYKWENILTYNFKIKNDHEFTLTGVTSWSHDRSDETYQYQDNIANNSYLWYNMNGTGTVTSSYSMSKGLGYVGRLNYSYLGRYLFSTSVRHDGSSKLAAGHRWSTYPAFSMGWRIFDEKFMEKTKDWLDNLKLRIGYGVTGTANIDPYSSVSSVETGYYSLGGELVNIQNFAQNYTNADLTWEKSHNWNFGLDAAFFNNRIDITADYYLTHTDGVIWKQYLPVTMGAYDASTQYYMYRNIAKTENRGLELAVNTRNIVTKNFKWNTSFTFTSNKEEVKKLADGTSDNVSNGTYTLSKGHPVNSFYNYKIDGIWQTSEATDAAVFGCSPGDIKINVPGMVKVSDGVFAQTTSDGTVTEYTSDNKYTYSGSDYQIIGHHSPDWMFGMQNQFFYKNFDLTVYTYFRWGQMINYEMLGYYDPTGVGNFPTYFNYWTADNPSNDFPALNASKELKSYTGYSALNYVDGSFFKIKNITLGYTCPKSFLKNLFMENCRLYATVTNPLVVAKSHLLKDYDPEMDGSLNYPLTKQIVLGVKVTF